MYEDLNSPCKFVMLTPIQFLPKYLCSVVIVSIISVGVLATSCYNCLHNTNTPFVDCYQNVSAVPTVTCAQGWCQVKQFDPDLEQHCSLIYNANNNNNLKRRLRM